MLDAGCLVRDAWMSMGEHGTHGSMARAAWENMEQGMVDVSGPHPSLGYSTTVDESTDDASTESVVVVL